ncbi:hypothetical protein [Variovorax saccharolyticus]|uniref:hypothetical protein n=1 Tax=Variovorax saccharolyticus TaxID=3053516 RepID=UPI002575C448|nr:hypothetical protein [Variovorax sp. J31P216]MDM0030163.1 hypothetical protein [Variovorax sp. J31P216]
MDEFDLTPPQLQLLADAGFVAIRLNRPVEARTIFETIGAFRAAQACVPIGLALALACERRFDAADRLLAEAHDEAGADRALMATFRSMVAFMAADPEACLANLPSEPSLMTAPLAAELRKAVINSTSPAHIAWRRLHQKEKSH